MVADVDALLPKGFRAVGISQGVLEYGKPIFEYVISKKGLDTAMAIVQGIWNYALQVEKGEEDSEIERVYIDDVKAFTRNDEVISTVLFHEMVKRRAFLFPPEMQVEKLPLLMIMRNEKPVAIAKYDYGVLDIAESPAPVKKSDIQFIQKLSALDKLFLESDDYSQWESALLDVQEMSVKCFGEWLHDKGLTQVIHEFADCPEVLINFVYAYMHDDIFTLKDFRMEYFKEFFFDYLLRKVTCEPEEYTIWPPALKLFYRFLHEKAYIENPDPIIKYIDTIEKPYIEILKERYA